MKFLEELLQLEDVQLCVVFHNGLFAGTVKDDEEHFITHGKDDLKTLLMKMDQEAQSWLIETYDESQRI